VKVKRRKVKIIAIIIVVLIALFFLLPVLSGNAPLPADMSAREIGSFLGGFFRYWIDAIRSAFGG
jgi:uncharacterized membrane protein